MIIRKLIVVNIFFAKAELMDGTTMHIQKPKSNILNANENIFEIEKI